MGEAYENGEVTREDIYTFLDEVRDNTLKTWEADNGTQEAED